jgi:hypothetical protein
MPVSFYLRGRSVDAKANGASETTIRQTAEKAGS